MGKQYMLRSRAADRLWPFIRSRLFSLLTSTQHFSELKDLESKVLIKSLPRLVRKLHLQWAWAHLLKQAGISIGRSPEVHLRTWHQLHWVVVKRSTSSGELITEDLGTQPVFIHPFIHVLIPSVSIYTHIFLCMWT